MATELNMKIGKPIEIKNRDVEFEVMIDGRKLGTLRLSRGSIDWRPTRGRGADYALKWDRFADLMTEHGTQPPRRR